MGQSLFMAARRPWTLFVSQKRAGGAFFCGTPGDLDFDQLWAPQGGFRGRAATPEADEPRRERREGTLRAAALVTVRRPP
jgi:hypothetical protein